MILLYIHIPKTEISLCFGLGHFKRIDQGHIIMTDAHALAAAAGHSFDDHRIFDLLGDTQRFFLGFDNAVTARVLKARLFS